MFTPDQEKTGPFCLNGPFCQTDRSVIYRTILSNGTILSKQTVLSKRTIQSTGQFCQQDHLSITDGPSLKNSSFLKKFGITSARILRIFSQFCEFESLKCQAKAKAKRRTYSFFAKRSEANSLRIRNLSQFREFAMK